MSKEKKVNRRFKFGAIATVITALVTVIIVLINVVFSVLTDRFNWIPDMTSSGMYDISDESKEFLKTVNQKVEIYVLMDEEYLTTNQSYGNYLPQAAEILKQYGRNSDNITLKYVNMVKDPTFAKIYPDLDLQEGQILIKSENRNRVIEVSDLFNFQTSQQYGYTSISSSKAEQTMTSAIMGVTSEDVIQISLLTGFDTSGPDALSALLTQNNYDIVEQNILTEDVDTESDIAILYGITRDLSADETKKLDKFLDNDGKLGKTLLYVSSNSMSDTPNLDALLKDWGMAIEKELIYETDTGRMLSSSSPFYFLVDAENSEFTQEYDFSSKFIGAGNARPITQLFETSGARKTTSLMSSADTAKAISSESFDAESLEDMIERDGPFNLLMMSEQSVSLGSDISKSYVIVSGSLEAVDDIFLSGSSFANAEYFANMFNTIYEVESGTVIAPKNFEYTEIAITFGTAIVYAAIFVIVVPLGIIVLGFIIWIRRRRR